MLVSFSKCLHWLEKSSFFYYTNQSTHRLVDQSEVAFSVELLSTEKQRKPGKRMNEHKLIKLIMSVCYPKSGWVFDLSTFVSYWKPIVIFYSCPYCTVSFFSARLKTVTLISGFIPLERQNQLLVLIYK